MTVACSDHSSVSQVASVADRNRAEEAVPGMGQQTVGMMDAAPSFFQLSFHRIHESGVRQRTPSQRLLGRRDLGQSAPVHVNRFIVVVQ